ncbi:GntR family transcriptional regulator [Pseudonocardia spinosispora]|uniref:GntR family transcriptional regulator n=1 Tax=Pseudonocardia spinosispora TaxID=103441 RepID=UPI001FDFD2DA|nr:GntR family transcriptional regulator [Pseudonocardia spinosispora]
MAEHVAGAVRSGELVAGGEVSPRELAEEFEVSFDVIDTALARLVVEGVLVRHGNGVRVRPVNRADLLRAYELRRVLDPQLAAEKVCSQSDDFFARLAGVAAARDDLTAPLSVRLEANERLRNMTIPTASQVQWQRRIMGMAWQQVDLFIPVVARAQVARGGSPWPQLGSQMVEVYQRRSHKAIRAWWQDYLDQGWLLIEHALDGIAC